MYTLINQYKGIIKYKVLHDSVVVLQELNDNRKILKLDKVKFNELWSIPDYSYSFLVHGNKIYSTTSRQPQATKLIDLNTGKVLEDNFEITFHFDGFYINEHTYICVADYRGEKIYILYDFDKEEIIQKIYPPLGINNIHSIIGSINYLSCKKEIVALYPNFSSNELWKVDLQEVIKDNHVNERMRIRIRQVMSCIDTIIINFSNDNTWSYLSGISIKTGDVKWSKRGIANFEIDNNKIFSLGLDGLLQILDPETGEIVKQRDLKEEFEKFDIKCDYRFTVVDDIIYFKHGRRGKFGILSLDTLKIVGVYQLPEGNPISTDEPPVPHGNRLYVRSATSGNLFIYEKE